MDNVTVRDALPALYEKYGLKSDGGVNDSSVKIELFKGFSLFIPNLSSRKKVVIKHDIHHLLTGYSAVMKGETEISAWEISTGCHHLIFPFFINTMGMMTGILFNLRGIWKAWKRGRQTSNLYRDKYVVDELMNASILSLKTELGLMNESTNHNFSFGALISFVSFLIFGMLLSILSIALTPLIVMYSLYVLIQQRWQKN